MNAIIMAAGMSSRFAPLSYEKPKGLLEVKGEILIERQIRQLLEAGITDITLVVGYMKEMFFYLEDAYGVNIVVNEDYFKYNNTSTLIRVLDKIDDTFICSSDNYFTENVFMEKPQSAYYAAEYAEGETDEYCLTTDENDIITKVTIGGKNAWYMIGHVFFSHDFSMKFKEILRREYEDQETKKNLWEDLYARYVSELPMKIKRYQKGIIKEFDSLDELREFDGHYINNTNSRILKNICKVLGCEEQDISEIKAIKQGLTNTSFYFTAANNELGETKFVYRHPGIGTSDYINRESECFSMDVAKQLGLDDTFIYMDKKEGWKLSRFIENVRTLDYHHEQQVETALSMMRKLHEANIKSEFRFGTWDRSLEFVEKIRNKGRADFADFQNLLDMMEALYKLTKSDGVGERLCHCDCYDPNFLIDENDKMYLIDWEYSGNDDPATDLGTFICCSDYTEEEALEVIKKYIGHEPSTIELRHHYAYVALAAYYWYVWAIYQTSVGNNVGEYLYLWYRMAKNYCKKAMPMYLIKD